MKKLLLSLAMGVAGALALPSSPCCAEEATEPLTILTIGDSITEGGSGRPTVDGYRTELGRLLDAAGVDHRFVSEGVGGTTSADWAKRIGDVMSRTEPDLVLIGLGTNDPGAGVNTYAQYVSLLGQITDAAPDAEIGISYVQYTARCDWWRAWLPAAEVNVNVAIDRAAWSSTRVVAKADFQTIPPQYLSADCVHPSPEGYNKMGGQWYRALASHYGWPPLAADPELTYSKEQAIPAAVVAAQAPAWTPAPSAKGKSCKTVRVKQRKRVKVRGKWRIKVSYARVRRCW